MVSPASKYCQSEARRLSAIVRERSGAGHVGLNGFPPWAMLAYHVSAMNSKQDSSEDIQGAAESALHDAASRLKELLSELARSLRPFPAFLNMSSVQAVELEPSFTPAADHGCVVVLPEGEICEMDLSVMPGIQGVGIVGRRVYRLCGHCHPTSLPGTSPAGRVGMELVPGHPDGPAARR